MPSSSPNGSRVAASIAAPRAYGLSVLGIFPPTPGKIPSTDNPYALGAAIEAATLLPLGLELGIAGPLVRAASAVEGRAAETVIKPDSFSIADWPGYAEYVPRP